MSGAPLNNSESWSLAGGAWKGKEEKRQQCGGTRVREFSLARRTPGRQAGLSMVEDSPPGRVAF